MPRRKFDMPKAKRAIMFVFGAFFGVWSALSGIGAQSAAGPFAVFMLGYVPEKAAATALSFALWTSVAGIAGWALHGATPFPLLVSLLVTLGSVVGVVVLSKPSRGPVALSLRRPLQALSVFIGVYVLMHGVRPGFGGPPLVPLDLLRTPAGWAATGMLCGAAAQLFAVPAGVLLVPALVFGTGLPPGAALMVSLASVALAAAIPVAAASARGLVDRSFGRPMTLGGMIGGYLAGMVLGMHAPALATWPMVSFGVTAMLLCAWTAYRSSL